MRERERENRTENGAELTEKRTEEEVDGKENDDGNDKSEGKRGKRKRKRQEGMKLCNQHRHFMERWLELDVTEFAYTEQPHEFITPALQLSYLG